jgi:signal transduction histidine kinase
VAAGFFWATNVVVLWNLSQWTTVPFHFIWVTLTLLYGYTVWRNSVMAIVLCAICLSTGLGLWHAAGVDGGPSLDELTEIPLMSAMFLAMVWHARRRDAALRAVRSSAEKERAFARDASHLLRTPIAVSRGHAELIRDANLGTQTGRDAQVVLDELERLSRISQRLLILASADQAGFLRHERVELEELIVTTAQRWGPTADREWRVDAPADGFIDADAENLGNALDALIENALRFTAPGDTIAITARMDGDQAVIEVADSGTGIAPDKLPTVFERFARTRSGGAAGLGLPMVKAIVEARGGGVSAGRSTLGGASFVIRLPAVREPERRRLGALIGARDEPAARPAT